MDIHGKLNQLHVRSGCQNPACTHKPRIRATRKSKKTMLHMDGCWRWNMHVCVCLKHRNTQRISRPKATPEPTSLCLCGNLVIFSWAQFFEMLVEFFFLSQACWESANHHRRQQISPASGYIFWSLQGSGRVLFLLAQAYTIVCGYNPCLSLKHELSKTK